MTDDDVKNKVEVNSEECTGCGVCVDACDQNALQISPEVNQFGVHPVKQKLEVCGGCGACYYICPEPGAITMYHHCEGPHE